MSGLPIRRGAARRLGLRVPLEPLTVRIEPDLSWFREACRAAASLGPVRINWGAMSIEAHQRALRGDT